MAGQYTLTVSFTRWISEDVELLAEGAKEPSLGEIAEAAKIQLAKELQLACDQDGVAGFFEVVHVFIPDDALAAVRERMKTVPQFKFMVGQSVWARPRAAEGDPTESAILPVRILSRHGEPGNLHYKVRYLHEEGDDEFTEEELAANPGELV